MHALRLGGYSARTSKQVQRTRWGASQKVGGIRQGGVLQTNAPIGTRTGSPVSTCSDPVCPGRSSKPQGDRSGIIADALGPHSILGQEPSHRDEHDQCEVGDGGDETCLPRSTKASHADGAGREFVEIRGGCEQLVAGAANIGSLACPHARFDGLCNREQAAVLRQVQSPNPVTLQEACAVPGSGVGQHGKTSISAAWEHSGALGTPRRGTRMSPSPPLLRLPSACLNSIISSS